MPRITVGISAKLLADLMTKGEVWPEVRCIHGLPRDARFLYCYFRGQTIFCVFESMSASGEITPLLERIEKK